MLHVFSQSLMTLACTSGFQKNYGRWADGWKDGPTCIEKLFVYHFFNGLIIRIRKSSGHSGTKDKPFGAETGKTTTIVLRGYVLNTEDGCTCLPMGVGPMMRCIHTVHILCWFYWGPFFVVPPGAPYHARTL